MGGANLRSLYRAQLHMRIDSYFKFLKWSVIWEKKKKREKQVLLLYFFLGKMQFKKIGRRQVQIIFYTVVPTKQ